MEKLITIHLKVWKQNGPGDKGHLEEITASEISTDMSFLEMLDVVNERLIKAGKDPIAFDSDCREGICGSCGCVINGQPHGPKLGIATCQLHMRSFEDGQTVIVEPWRARAFPVIKDLVVDRSAFDRIIASGGYVSVKSGPHADANAMLVPKPLADQAMDAATCIGCGACVAACPNASASLFLSAKVAQFSLLPQGQPERYSRVGNMVKQHDSEGFGNCTNIGECHAACPKEISIKTIALMKRDYFNSLFLKPEESARSESD